MRALVAMLLLGAMGCVGGWAQSPAIGTPAVAESGRAGVGGDEFGLGHAARSQRFLRGRRVGGGARSAAEAYGAARAQHAAMVREQAAAGQISPLSAMWTAVGPMQVASPVYGNLTGRITSLAVDPADPSGNTVYLGTTGGGVWKSTNAAGDAQSVQFVPLTDTLPVFSPNAGTTAIPSLSIGAMSVQAGPGGGVVLAGTGDPNDALDSYYGSGILRSADGGLTWTLIQNSMDRSAGLHTFAGLSFAGFAWSSTSPNLAVAAVSQALEGDLVNAANTSYSEKGLYFSTDAGVTWQMAVIVDGSSVLQSPQPLSNNHGGVAATAVVWNPVRQRFYAALRYHGYYESADGMTWTRLAHQPGTGLSLAACPTISGAVGSTACPIYRGSLAVQPVTGDLFALTVDGNNLDQGLWQDVCGLSGTSCASTTVTFGTRLGSTALEAGGGSTVIPGGDYNLSIAAMPTATVASAADTLLFVGTTDLYRCSLAGGCTLRNTTNATNGCAAPAKVAPAQHAIALTAASTGTLVYLGNDGGLWRSTDGVAEQGAPCSTTDASHFQNLNGGLGSLAEPTSFAQDPVDPGILLVGLGAAGTAGVANATTSPAWPQLSAGEGGTVAIDPSHAALWYISTAGGVSLHQCSSGSACTAASFAGAPTVGPAQVASDLSVLDAPWILDPAMPADVLIGTCRAWRGPAGDGTVWSGANAISTTMGVPQSMACRGTGSLIASLAAGGPMGNAAAAQNAGSAVLYAGLAGVQDGGGSYGGHLFSTKNAGIATSATAWSDLATGTVTNDTADHGVFNPGGFAISSIAADSHDATGKTVYATVAGFAGNQVGVVHVYRTLDGGATWTNISSNLPNAPANSVVVDPNDANTIYVAMDTGIYVTTQVTNCVVADCWSVFGIGIPNAPVVGLEAAAAMATGDGRIGELRAATYGRGIWQIPLVTAAYPAQPALSLTPTSLQFPLQSVNTLSSGQTVTVTNTGAAGLLVSSAVATGDFSATTTCTGSVIAPGASCTVQVRFQPTATGTRAGTLTVYGNVAGGQATASLVGQGAPPAAIVLNPVVVNFAATTVGVTSTAQNVTISNTGGVTAGLQSITVSGDFHLAVNTCGSSLNASTGCTVAITFLPTTPGPRTGLLTVVDDVGTQTAVLSGNGSAPATDGLTPAVLQFGPQQLNTGSALQQITLTNAGDLPLVLIQARIVQGDFAVINSCGNSLAAHSSCSMSVTFQPKSVGPESGTLSVTDEYRSQTIALSGTGVAPPGVSISPINALSFAALGVGISSVPQTVTLTNNGGEPLSLQQVGVTGDFLLAPGGTCGGGGTVLSVGSGCTIEVVFLPTAAGPRSGALRVTDNALNSPQAISLSGTGVDFALTADGSTAETIASGKSAVFPLLLTSVAGVPGTAALTCTGLPANSACVVSPGASVALGSTTTVAVTVNTGLATTTTAATAGQGEGQGDGPRGGGQGLWLATLLPIGIFGVTRSRLRSSRLACMGMLGCLLLTMGCGATRRIPVENTASGTGSTSLTAPGTYVITASAASAGLVRSIQLTLVVQ